MKLFLCDDCGKYFKTPKEEKESRGEWFGFPSYETVYRCPHCRGYNGYEFEEVEVDEDPRTPEQIEAENQWSFSMADLDYGRKIFS